ncbi:putative peptidase S10, serine carboxypeptidase, alpha/Beta hydrolase [Plasmopara halstedii]
MKEVSIFCIVRYVHSIWKYPADRHSHFTSYQSIFCLTIANPMKLSIFLTPILSLSSAVAYDAHRVGDLPGLRQGDVPFSHFAGQLHLPSSTNEKLFYWYAQSRRSPASDPIVLWLNGGPGCASSEGFFTENGPFVAKRDGTVGLNPYGWNARANIVWVDSPSGVGFSKPLQTTAGYYNDNIVSDRLRLFLREFYNKYPELQGHDFYLAGESYAGMYIPFLVERLVDDPLEGVHLKGFAIGNPLTDMQIDGNAYMEYYYSHALISHGDYLTLLDYCEHNISQCMFTNVNCTSHCEEAVIKAHEAADTDEFNHYYIYGDVCRMRNNQRNALHSHLVAKMGTKYKTHRGVVGPCAGDFTRTLLNRMDVQEALHIEGDLPMKWIDCQSYISHNFDRTFSTLDKYRKLLGNGLKVLIYSGDSDSVVNFMGTQRWITEDYGLALKPVSPWRAWLGPDDQIAGYHQQFELGLTFKTVKGAGHMVPAVRPLHGLHLFDCFLYGDECSKISYPSDPFEREAAGGILTSASNTNKKNSHHDEALAQQSQATVSQATDPKESASGITISLFISCAFLMLAVTVYAHRHRRERGYTRQQYQRI